MEFILQITLTPVIQHESMNTEKKMVGRPLRVIEAPVEEAKPEVVTRIKLNSHKMDDYLGKIGERNTFRLVLREQKSDRIGTTSRWTYLFQEEPTGRNVIWMTYRDHRLEKGQTYNLKASIKKFYDARGVKSTLVTRGKISDADE
jgi:hypothetical protein